MEEREIRSCVSLLLLADESDDEGDFTRRETSLQDPIDKTFVDEKMWKKRATKARLVSPDPVPRSVSTPTII